MNQSARRNIIAPAEGALHLMDTSFSRMKSTSKPVEDLYPLNLGECLVPWHLGFAALGNKRLVEAQGA
jgi:hypothetical protein